MRCVLLFARSPRAEERRKRLPGSMPVFDYAQRRLAAAVAGLPGVDLVIVGSGPADAPAVHRLRQRGAGFGERLRHAFDDVLALGYDEVVAVPGDAPGLGADHLAAAFSALETRDAVFGPSPDGGVWLIGIQAQRVAVGPVLAAVPWLTPRVFHALASNTPCAAVLGSLLDLDRPGDAARLAKAAEDPLLRIVLRALLGQTSDCTLRSRTRASSLFAPVNASPRAPPTLLSAAFR